MEPTALQYLAILVGIPAVVVVVLALAILAPGWTRAGRYRPGEPWNYEPILINGSNTNDVDQAIAITAVAELGEDTPVAGGQEGGTSAQW